MRILSFLILTLILSCASAQALEQSRITIIGPGGWTLSSDCCTSHSHETNNFEHFSWNPVGGDGYFQIGINWNASPPTISWPYLCFAEDKSIARIFTECDGYTLPFGATCSGTPAGFSLKIEKPADRYMDCTGGDTDGDGYSNYQEDQAGTSKVNPNDFPDDEQPDHIPDRDGDGVPDDEDQDPDDETNADRKDPENREVDLDDRFEQVRKILEDDMGLKFVPPTIINSDVTQVVNIPIPGPGGIGSDHYEFTFSLDPSANPDQAGTILARVQTLIHSVSTVAFSLLFFRVVWKTVRQY